MDTYIYRFFIFWYCCGIILLTFDILPPWLEWANSVFLITAGIVAGIYFLKLYGRTFGIIYSFFIIIISILVEHWGVHYDFLFGSYDYMDNFGLKIADTPITIGFAWLLIIGCSHEISRVISRLSNKPINRATYVLVGGLLAVTMDLILDPVAYKVKNYWVWQDSGIYYGIPFSNFTGWFVLACFFHLVFVLWSPSKNHHTERWEKRMATVFGLIILMFCVIALAGRLYGAICLVLVLTLLWYALYMWRRRYD